MGGGSESNLNCQAGRNAALLTAAHLEVPRDARRWTLLIGRDYFLIRGSIGGSRPALTQTNGQVAAPVGMTGHIKRARVKGINCRPRTRSRSRTRRPGRPEDTVVGEGRVFLM